MIVLIDGPSGSGKTTLARKLAGILGFELVHLDDLYPGWHGLAEGSRMVAEDVLGEKSGYWQWDWQHYKRGQWVPVRGENIVIEGVGSITRETVAASKSKGYVFSVVLDGPEAWRKERALARDPDDAPWWNVWAEQEKAHFQKIPDVDVRLWLGEK
ncbi:(d)CMP kinase [Corynebacterium pseudotuberculosis]|uniref:AAA family ATPase n=1 Tax=Corynebacterium pseudotuberculosis (strain C231) TaxID=681645 RepID=D9Q9L3_CORP2|nr:(d)CMP kinase [Corynebacterium pseudotuberculosis]ADK28551.1 AAA family ATPase [Corynebacterium pseudotuberculosis FRC41]ADL10239.1 AAA family ATPase [Corynebacterium pseudotuberculosis C231]ADL20648.1 AAA family ATPase [Corynebacterium pseudotuberculosis 1002]ADO26031.1 AAA family ATPase [Corynebacterium pseudotuberculosis I19]AEK92088.1 Hypothetical protein CpPAT10_0756 [Corynebacterium pseudotuberculosis PAT10]